AWLSLDKNDNDLSRFLIYLVAALQRIDSQIGVDVQAALQESLSPNFEIVLTRLISEMERLPDKSIIVLDDCHLIDSKPVHDIINFLIEYLPPTIHLVISGRTDPPLPISRLRVQGNMNEVRTSQLRFTKKEVATFLNDRMGFDLPTEGIAALEARTEGWIASLKLAALSMQGRDDWPEFIAKFSGSNRYVIDYLVDEVMARQPDEVQIFLRRTSILERFCASLGEFVAGESKDTDIIDYIDRSNLFLIPLDDHKEWYRYHHLFADFLSQRLRASEPDRIPELHRRASQWYENEGWVDEAIQHALAAGDMDRATRLVDGIAVELLVRAESNKLLKLVEQLPFDLWQGYPMLRILYAWALLFMGQLERVDPILTSVEVDQAKAPGVPNPGYVTTVRAYLANRQGDIYRSIQLTEQALEELSSATPDRLTLKFQGSAFIWLGVNHRMLGNLDKARQLFMEAAGINQKAGNYYASLASYEQLADLAVIRGQLHQALDLYRSGLKLAQNWKDTEGKPHRSLMETSGLQLGLGVVLYQLNDLAGAATHIQYSTDLFELGEHYERKLSYTMLAYLKQAQGEFETSAELLRKACAIEDTIVVRRSYTSDRSSPTKLAMILSRAGPERAHLLTDASRRVMKLGVRSIDKVDFTSPADYPRELMYSDLACLLIAQDRADEALPLLSSLLEAAITMGRHGDEIRYLVLMTLAHHALGDMQTALDFLSRALTLAEPEGYVRLFVDEGPPMAELLNHAISQNITPEYASKLLAAFPNELLSVIPIAKELTVTTQMLVEPLSEREIEVLHLMAEGYKYKEIAERLVVSINTVRYHTRNIYGKLNATNRTQAIGRAKELNLL
ncbi:MAG TPA: LuxR C-terminal-related transcriptional regulator, partial [Anaerolineales bacterium]|nr:LuxR C-terminal-related transcriptional regulator [Anaerolineales bacterium]